MNAYALLDMPDGHQFVIRNADGATIPQDEGNADYQTYLTWLADGNTPDPPPTPDPINDPSTAQYQFALRSMDVQTWLDTTAQENYYRDSDACVSYLASENAVYATDAKAMSDWRDALWPAFNAMPENWPSDPAQWPLWDAIQPLLPQPVDYGWESHDPVGASPDALATRRGKRP